jgi:fermentation-respiration switch protein FrsA (DUF1100 family)
MTTTPDIRIWLRGDGHLTDEALTLLIDAEASLDAPALSALSTHLDDCGSCQARWGDLARASTALDDALKTGLTPEARATLELEAQSPPPAPWKWMMLVALLGALSTTASLRSTAPRLPEVAKSAMRNGPHLARSLSEGAGGVWQWAFATLLFCSVLVVLLKAARTTMKKA